MPYHGGMPALVFIVRVLLGVLFIFAGGLKVGHFNDLAAAIAGFRILPPSVVAPLALALPFFELGVGVYLILGLFTRAVAAIAGLQLAVYAIAIASAVVRHIPANCGCFGPQDSVPADWPHVVVDLCFAAGCGLVSWRAPGALSVDNRMRK